MNDRYDLYITINDIDEHELTHIRNAVLRTAGVATDVSISSNVIAQPNEDMTVSVNQFAHSEPTEPGFYKYSGGADSMLFLLDLRGQWWVWSDNGEVNTCAWGYIEQALSVWDLVKV